MYTYRCSFVGFLAALLCLSFFNGSATAQGVLANGSIYFGAISVPGQANTYTFTANAGENLVIKVGKITSTNNFVPRIRLINPDSVQQALASDASAPEIAVLATNTGTFTVIVDDTTGTIATGNYSLTMAMTGSPLVITPGYPGGALTNGFTYQADMPVGALDAWSFTATAGESFVVRAGETSTASNFLPWVRVYGPDGVLLGSNSGLGFGEVTFQATNSGTILVLVDNNPYYNSAGNGSYALTLAETGSPLVITPGYAGGALTNGSTYQAGMPIGALDAWSFTATAGEAVVVRAGETSTTNDFQPWVRIYGPDGTLQGSDYGLGFGEVTFRSTNSGTFLVVVGNNPYYNDSGDGTYSLTFAETGSPLVITPGYPGGALTNGSTYQAGMPTGALDAWSFTATTGEAFVVRAGETSATNSFQPWVRIYGPDGTLQGSDYGFGFGEVTFQATNSGTFLVVIGNNPYYNDFADGTYSLTLAETGSPLAISPGYPGGPLTNGFTCQANMPIGALEAWNFTATAGEAIVVRAGETSSTNDFQPWVRLYGPNGSLLGSSFGLGFGEVAVRATNSGTFLVVIGNNPYYSDSGDGTYALTLAETGSPLVLTPGYPGGSLTNGSTYQAGMPIGALDAWSFTATTGEAIVVRAGETSTTNNFQPWVRIYGPDGTLQGSDYGVGFGEVAVQATNSGTFLVVIGNNPYYSDFGAGTYALTLAETGSPLLITPGYPGGSLTGAITYTGNMPIGAIDPWTFTTCVGENIVIQADVLNSTNQFDCWIRLYGPNGDLIGSNAGTISSEVSLQATNSGRYLVVIGNNSYYNDYGSGTYLLTVNGLSDGFKTCSPFIAGSTLYIGGVGGPPGTNGVLFTATNVTTPLALWSPVRTNQFDQFGVFEYTNLFNPAEPQRYFRLAQP